MSAKKSADSLPAPSGLEAEAVIARFYRSVVAVPTDEYRAWALDSMKDVIPHDGALWGSGAWIGRRFHTITVNGLPEDYPRALERSADENPLIRHLLTVPPNTPTTMADVFPDDQFFKSDLYRKVFEPFGVNRILSTVHLDRRSGVYSLVSLYRKDRAAMFTPEEKELQKRLTFHLFNAASHSFFMHLLRTQRERPGGAHSAVVDRRGTYHEAQPRFLDALDAHFPRPSAGRPGVPEPGVLPFPLPEPGEIRQVGSGNALCVKSEAMGDMFVVHVWPAGPLDRLTSREREIVVAVAHGLSFKQAARKIGVAPSTVANHLYRIYRKLNVNSRTELADLIHAPTPH